VAKGSAQPLARHSVSGWGGLQALKIFIELSLQLADLLQRPFCQDGKVAGVLGQNLVPVRFKNTLHAAHLLDGLIDLFWCLDHTVTSAGVFEPRNGIANAEV